jgi:hypothetical protein
MSAISNTPCEKCGAATELETCVTPVGHLHPGAKIYRCTACGWLTWVVWESADEVIEPTAGE